MENPDFRIRVSKFFFVQVLESYPVIFLVIFKKMNNQLTKSNPGSIIEQNQTNVQEAP